MSWHKHLTDHELQRIQFFVLSGRINETLLEVVDFWTDVVFMATLWLFAQAGSPGDSFLGVLASTGDVSTSDYEEETGERDYDLFRNMAIVASTILVFNVVMRSLIALKRLKRRDEFKNLWDWAQFIVGIFITIVEPHNGLLWIDSIFEDKVYLKSDYNSTVQEIKLNLLLVCAEDLPQFVLQIIFANVVKRQALTVSWYVATLTTSLKLVGMIAGVIIMATKLKGLKKQLQGDGAQVAAKSF